MWNLFRVLRSSTPVKFECSPWDIKRSTCFQNSNLNIHINVCTSLKYLMGTSLVAQWLRIRLPMQGTQVQALVWEDPTCHRATKLMRHNYWACALEPKSHNYWACMPQLLKPTRLEPVLCNKRSHRSEKPTHSNEE